MPTDEILTLEIEPPYIGSAVSPTVDIAENTDDITVTITDFRGEHSYTVEKTDQAIEDAEQAAQNANDTAQTVAQGWANRQNEINVTMNSMRTLMTNSANAESQRVIAENARVDAENAREQEWEELSTNATAATSAANEAAGQATNKAGLADTAAQNADTATTAANAAATTATTAAEQADAAREAIQDDLAAKADKDGYYQQLTAGLADTLMSGDTELVQFAQRTSDHDGMVDIQSIHGNTIVWNQIVEDTDDSVSIPNTHVYVARINGVVTRGVSDNTALAVVGGRDNMYDLTRMFGAGNEPATVEEFERMYPESYYPYDAGSLLSVNVEGVKTVGFNQWDIDAIPVMQGTFEHPTNLVNVHTEDYIPVLPNTKYMQRHETLSKLQGQYVKFFDADKTQIGNSISIYSTTSFSFTTPKNTRYVRFMWYTTSGIVPADIMALHPCLNISNPSLNGTYKPYRESTRTIPASTYFPDGMRSAGTAYDEIDYVNHKAITRIGSRAYANGDESDTSVITDGTTTFYALTTPTETDLPETMQATYPVEIGGTESIVISTGEQSAPPTMAIAYGYTADGVRDVTQSIVAPVERGVASSNYAVGAYLVMGGTLYRATTAIATGETISPGTNCTATTVMAELIALMA